LGYPGGPVIERLAREGNEHAVPFALPRMSDGRPDFSFSGLNTAVAKYVRENNVEPVAAGAQPSQAIKDLAASFQSVVVRALVGTMERLAREHHPRTLIVAGGVACNGALRAAAQAAAQRLDVPCYFPSHHLSTDNAAMIAAAGSPRLSAGQHDDLTLTADVTLRLQNYALEDDELRRQKVRYKL
jgi:N6-L-threonylcarbamoyladenine synthase